MMTQRNLARASLQSFFAGSRRSRACTRSLPGSPQRSGVGGRIPQVRAHCRRLHPSLRRVAAGNPHISPRLGALCPGPAQHRRPRLGLRQVLAALRVLILAVALPATTASAQQSPEVFARGFGSKAAALGNSFVSIADDASAVFWNPAGTGWIARKTFTFSVTDMYFPDVEYSSASYVHPVGRAGALGISLTRWGVEGIEKRDENNLLIRDDLTERQMEFIASYSSPPVRRLTAGIGVKADMQMLDEEEAFGVGIDLGLLYRRGSRPCLGRPCFSTGLNVRNIIEPALTMRADRTSFPTKAIFSASYSSGRAPYLDNWTLAFDLNAPSGLPASANFGLEASVRPVSFRMGSQDGRLTAGIGTFWEGLSFDYAYIDEDYGRLHTFSLTLAFGKPSAALADHEEDKEEKLAAQ